MLLDVTHLGVTYRKPILGGVCVCVVIPFVLDVRLVDAPAAVTQEEGHSGCLHLPSEVFALFFIVRRSQSSFPSSTVKSTFFVYPRINRSPLVPVRVTAPRFELTSQRQEVSRSPTEPPGDRLDV